MTTQQSTSHDRRGFRRVLLKLSGEALAPAHGSGVDLDALAEITREVKEIASLGIELAGVATRVLSAIAMQAVCEPYIRRRAVRHLEKGRVVIFAAGTGNPYFTTDTAASLRAMEINAEVILKATKVDGVYSADPVKDPKAERYTQLSYIDVLKKNLKVMDSTAISLCMDNDLPIIVFDLGVRGNILRVVQGEEVGTTVGTLKPRAA